jgi:hypothetical protein
MTITLTKNLTVLQLTVAVHTLVLAAPSETFPRTVGPNGLTRAEITNELAWVLYTHRVGVPPISGHRASAPFRRPSRDFLDGLDAMDARTGTPLGSSGFTREDDHSVLISPTLDQMCRSRVYPAEPVVH